MSIGLPWLQCARKEFVQLLQRRFGKPGQFAAVRDQRVGGQHTRSASVGQNRQPRASGPRLLAQHFGHVKEVGDVVHTQHAAAAEGRIENFVASGQRSRCATPQPWTPLPIRPALMTMIGLLRATSRAAERNDRASPTDSM